MSGPLGSSQWMYSSGGFYPTVIDQSLKFDGTSYLSRTPSVAGNRKTWTWSGWVKRGALGANEATLFSSRVASTYTQFSFRNNGSPYPNQFLLQSRTGGSEEITLVTTQVFRDASAWYHIVVAVDTTQGTSTNRAKIYSNGSQITSFSTSTYPSQNLDTMVNFTQAHAIGNDASGGSLFDGYQADTYFVDGQALDPTSFGEFKSGVWIPKAYEGSYGTNGFHLTYQDDTVSEGFNTVTWNGNGGTQSISGLGFEPDLVWVKERSQANDHVLIDSVRGISQRLESNNTDAEVTMSPVNLITSIDADGFSLGSNTNANENGQTYVGWCWDAGDSTVSNTDGSITSSVRANPAYGFSIVSYTGTGAAATVGHGLGVAPNFWIFKRRDGVIDWEANNDPNSSMYLDDTDAQTSDSGRYTMTSSTLGLNAGYGLSNVSGASYIAYCFADIAGYSKFGSYTGTGASGNAVTTGFKPAFVMMKRTDSIGNWVMFDATRSTQNTRSNALSADLSDREYTSADGVVGIDFTDTGFTLQDNHTTRNASGGTYIYMAFADTRDLAFWRDQSGNGNDWQPNNLNYQDTVFDSPTNNYATWNPLVLTGGATLSKGNLNITGVTAFRTTPATIAMTSGKWYWENKLVTYNTGTDIHFGVCLGNFTDFQSTWVLSTANGWGYTCQGGLGYHNNTSTNISSSARSTGDTIGIAFDADAGDLYVYVNGAIVNGGSPIYTGLTSGPYFPFVTSGDSIGIVTANFGQSGFTYTPPTGFLALCTANLPEPSISPADEASPQDHFNTVLYTGNGGTQSITGVGFQPDLVWVKNRQTTNGNVLNDAVRGAGQWIFPDSTSAEGNYSSYFTGFDLDGFSAALGGGGVNAAYNYVAWNWKASNATAVSNTAGSITSQVSANPTAGFSIVSYTGTAANATVGHGLGVAPDVVITKSRDIATPWPVYHSSNTAAPETEYLQLNATNATADFPTWNDTLPTSSVFSLGTTSWVNPSASPMIAYCFHSVEGYSKFSSYTGNGSADGPFAYTGFRPAFVMIKRTDSTGNWQMYDTSRASTNVMTATLAADLVSAESSFTGGYDIDFVSNGFKPRTGPSNAINASGGTYIYMAFAENPFKYANAR